MTLNDLSEMRNRKYEESKDYKKHFYNTTNNNKEKMDMNREF